MNRNHILGKHIWESNVLLGNDWDDNGNAHVSKLSLIGCVLNGGISLKSVIVLSKPLSWDRISSCTSQWALRIILNQCAYICGDYGSDFSTC